MANLPFTISQCLGLSQENPDNVETRCKPLYDRAISLCNELNPKLQALGAAIQDQADAVAALAALGQLSEDAINKKIAANDAQNTEKNGVIEQAEKSLKAARDFLKEGSLSPAQEQQLKNSIAATQQRLGEWQAVIDKNNAENKDLRNTLKELKDAQAKVEKTTQVVAFFKAQADAAANDADAAIAAYRACQAIRTPSPVGGSTVGDQKALSPTGLEPVSSNSGNGTMQSGTNLAATDSNSLLQAAYGTSGQSGTA